MAHFAKIDEDNKVVAVHVVSNDIATDEQAGIDFLKSLYPDSNLKWVQTSYNTYGGVHKLGGTPLRKNFASIGWTYDENKDAFIPPKPYNSWVYNENTADWDPPVERPDESTLTDNQCIHWNESTLEWEIENRT